MRSPDSARSDETVNWKYLLSALNHQISHVCFYCVAVI